MSCIFKKKNSHRDSDSMFRSVRAGKLFVLDCSSYSPHTKWRFSNASFYSSIVYFETFEQTLRLRLVSGPVDNLFFHSEWPNGLSRTVQYVSMD